MKLTKQSLIACWHPEYNNKHDVDIPSCRLRTSLRRMKYEASAPQANCEQVARLIHVDCSDVRTKQENTCMKKFSTAGAAVGAAVTK